ncbi:hypothetical protein GXP67_12495 [Rhodocytophaga rosea]|uniref:Uncharacterized protein n=1 Tax=Rhodocytophaga rosea TaxID=2704465 RepID=A0A6C0GI70_9BACT|nr:hypothetical protein [Rhodocytophaga rosea]QHT67393.1 hypothetical protein GXP67_12495 [Rhodocytophaga rosea]
MTLPLISCYGQDLSEKQVIEKVFEEYFETVKKKDNASTLEYLHPKIFDNLSKDKLMQSLDKMKLDTTMIMNFENAMIKSISNVIEVDKVKYTLLKYNFKLKIQINNSLISGNGTGKDNSIYQQFKAKYGEENVKYDPKDNTYSIDVSSSMYAINDIQYIGWKFLEKKDNMKNIIDKVIPTEALKELEK